MRRLVDNSRNVESNLINVDREPGKVSNIRAAVLKQFGCVTKENVEKYKKGLDS